MSGPRGDADVVHLVITWSHDLEQAFLDVGERGEDDDGSYHRDVPAELWQALLDAEQAREGAYRRILEAASFDGELGRMSTPCEAWVGDLDPGCTWWAVELAPGGDDPDTWAGPGRRVTVRDTQPRCSSHCPPEFLLLPTGGQLQHVRRDRLEVVSRGWARRRARAGAVVGPRPNTATCRPARATRP